MKQYDDAFELHKDLCMDKLLAEPVSGRIWIVCDKETNEKGFVFVDETEMFNPHIFKTIEECVKGFEEYNKHL